MKNKNFYIAFQQSSYIIFRINYDIICTNLNMGTLILDKLKIQSNLIINIDETQENLLESHLQCFYKKWKGYYIGNTSYKELINDIEFLKTKYNFVESEKEFRFFNIVEVSNSKIK